MRLSAGAERLAAAAAMVTAAARFDRRWQPDAQARPQILHHPAVVTELEKRTSDAQLRIADKITGFAGSMNFVYLHAFLFALWMIVFEKSPWPTLTLIVSLEAIFLSTFVMIGQNRQAAFQQAKADRDYKDVNTLLVENTDLTRAVHRLTEDVHESILGDATPPTSTPTSTPTSEPGPSGSGSALKSELG